MGDVYLRALTRPALDALRCMSPGCKVVHEEGSVMVVRAQCHPNSPLLVSYNPGSGCLQLACAMCDAPVALVQVASAVPS